jgi:hypothetical protein
VSRKAFLMRIDPALWAELERAAAADLRSVNGEIEYLLREALRRRGSIERPIETSQKTPDDFVEDGRED